MSIRYSSLQPPSKERMSIRRNTYSTSSSTLPDPVYSKKTANDVSPDEEEETLGVDTWSRLLVKLHYYIKQKEHGSAEAGEKGEPSSPMFPSSEDKRITQIIGDKTLSSSQLLATLQTLISKQNESIQIRRRNLLARRQAEEGLRATEAPSPHIENTLTATLWHSTLSASRERWQRLTSDVVDLYKTEVVRGPHRKEEDSAPKAALPTVNDLYDCLLEGVNSSSTEEALQPYIKKNLIAGIEKMGLLTDFKQHLHIFSHYHSLVPSFRQLQRYFEELSPNKIAFSTFDHLGTSLERYEMQLDHLLREGETLSALRPILLEGVHPALRRLVYARALQLPLYVTDGTPLIPAQTDIVNNHGDPQSLSTYLTFATKYSRDKIRRRRQHHYSSTHQELVAKTLQYLVKTDVTEYIGDSDKYFVYEDEINILLEAVTADKSLPEAKKNALLQLGRPSLSLDSYIVYLLCREGDLIHQRAPPSGAFPVSGNSMWYGPLGNITGDTVEQYELVTAMTAQLWSRLQGPTPELLQCCLLFEELIVQTALPASLHMRRILKYSPLLLALEWFSTGFGELLEPSELLVLWDLLVAYHVREMEDRSCLSRTVGLISLIGEEEEEGEAAAPCALWILPLLAAGVFTFRAPLIEKCSTKSELKSIFSVGGQLSVRFLLQYLLFECDVR